MKLELDKARCERAAGVSVKFSPRAWAELEDLAEYCKWYADPGAEGRRAPLFMAADWKLPLTPKQRANMLLTRVRGVAAVWRASGGVRRDRLNQLLESLFKQAGVKPPSARTLRRAVQAADNRRLDPWPEE